MDSEELFNKIFPKKFIKCEEDILPYQSSIKCEEDILPYQSSIKCEEDILPYQSSLISLILRGISEPILQNKNDLIDLHLDWQEVNVANIKNSQESILESIENANTET